MKIEKKHLIAGLIGLVTITGAVAYLQYKKLMNYTIKFKTIKVNSISVQLIDFNLFINFTNNSELKFDIIEQEHNVYINDKFVSKVTSNNPIQISPKSTSVLMVNVKFNPTEVFHMLGKNIVDILTKADTVNVKIDMKFKVKMYGIKLSIPYTYLSNLKELTASTK